METSHRVLYIYHGYFLFQSVMQYPCCHLTYFSKNSIARPKVYTTEKQVVARLVRNDQTIHMIVFINLYTIITHTRRINKNVIISYFNHFIKNTTILILIYKRYFETINLKKNIHKIKEILVIPVHIYLYCVSYDS